MNLEKIVANLVQKVERRFYGKYRGLVVDNADPELLGRLKLRVPSVLGGAVVTGWALPCVPYGGDANQGMLFIPEVGAGIWVEFEEGDLEFPIWVGTFWSKPGGTSELPLPNKPDSSEESAVQDPPTRKIIKTKRGHTIQFEDDPDDDKCLIVIYEGVHIHMISLDKDGINISDGVNTHVITLNGDGVNISDGVNTHVITLNNEGIKISDGKTNKDNVITFSSDGISIVSKADITLTGQKIILNAKGDMTLDSKGKLSATGNPIHLNP